MYEEFLLHQIFQILKNEPNEKFRFYILENTYLSPDFKTKLGEVHKSLNMSFKYEFLNMAWPEKLLSRPTFVFRQIAFWRFLFND